MLRRLKEDVLHDLPPKIIQDYYCELSPVQKALYDEFSKSQAAEEAGEAVSAEAKPGQGHVFQSLQYLRKLCNHPALVLDGEEGKRRWGEVVKKIGGTVPPVHDLSHAPKLEALRWVSLRIFCDGIDVQAIVDGLRYRPATFGEDGHVE